MSRLTVFAAALFLSLAAACGAQPGTDRPPAPGASVLNPMSAKEILSEMADDGLPLPNPRDVTAQECPELGCLAKIDTETVSILKFPTTGAAQTHAGSTVGVHFFQLEDMVLIFGPGLPRDQWPRFEAALKKAIR